VQWAYKYDCEKLLLTGLEVLQAMSSAIAEVGKLGWIWRLVLLLYSAQ